MTLATSDFDYIRHAVQRESAIVLEPGKEYLVESRLAPLARQIGAESISGLVGRLQRGEPRLLDKVVDAMTTNETSFFRDNYPFDMLRTKVLPELVAQSANRHIDVWCGASSSGQEPYTIAMVMQEVLPSSFTSSLLATDISEEMLFRTREGRYSQLEVNRGLPVTMLVKHFDKVGTDWQVKPALRSTVKTRAVNLSQPFPVLGAFDVVFLRNVLIYFNPPTKAAVLQRVRQVLRPGGYLFLGGAESTLTIDDAWERVVHDRATAYRPRG
ncbi:MAG: methyltransferase, CheR-type [Frankiales bacterium]|nr:methyltransferase, CheR-type [Frankiales bacterium]